MATKPVESLLPPALRRKGARAAKPANGETLLLPRGALDQTSITGKRGGRPLGAKNKRLKTIKDLLAHADAKGIKVIEDILDMTLPPELQGNMKALIEMRDLQLKTVALAWAYRHGKPREMAPVEGEPDSPYVPMSGNGDGRPLTGGVAFFKIGGSEKDYVAGMQKLGKLMQGAAPPSAPEPEDGE